MKNLFLILSVIFVSLLTSCSREEATNSLKDSNRVCIFPELSEDAAGTRAQIDIAATHKLRCIIEVWTKEASPVLVHREEVAIEAGALPPFEFDLEAGDYYCLVWADFIERGAGTTSVTSDEVTYDHYTEIYYNTANLHNILILDEDAANLFDTDLCDAFFAQLELKKEDNGISKQLKLTRPFAKLIVKEKNVEKFSELKKLKAVYAVPEGFNVYTGEPTNGTKNAVLEKEFEVGGDSQVLFTQYIFAPSSMAGKALGTMALSFTTESRKDCEIAAGSIIIKRNEKVNASGNLITEGAIDPGPGPDPEPEDPKIGDYFFIDGTWGSELTAENKDDCVGIVYAVGVQTGDDISAYGASAAGKQILGYVMALNSTPVSGSLIPDGGNTADYIVGDRVYFYKQASGNLDPLVEKYPAPNPAKDWMTHDGFSITRQLLAAQSYSTNKLHYPALYNYVLWKEDATTGTPENASEWYLPSGAQLLTCMGKYYSFAGKADATPVVPAMAKDDVFTAALENAIAEGIAKNFTNGTASARNVLTVTLNKDAAPLTLQVTAAGVIAIPNFTWKLQGYMRPVLTIIK